MRLAPPLRTPPIGFATAGTVEAVRLALKLGATGIETAAWRTADGRVVLGERVVGGRLRRRRVSELRRDELPAAVAGLEDLYAASGTGFDLLVRVEDEATAAGLAAAARDAGAPERLWVAHHDWQRLAGWRAALAGVRLVDVTKLGDMKDRPERRAAQLAQAGIDAVHLHRSSWSGGMTALFHRFDRYAFGGDAQFERHLDELLDAGVDAVSGDHPDRIADALAKPR